MDDFKDIEPKPLDLLPDTSLKDRVAGKQLKPVGQEPNKEKGRLNWSDYWNIVKGYFINVGSNIMNGINPTLPTFKPMYIVYALVGLALIFLLIKVL